MGRERSPISNWSSDKPFPDERDPPTAMSNENEPNPENYPLLCIFSWCWCWCWVHASLLSWRQWLTAKHVPAIAILCRRIFSQTNSCMKWKPQKYDDRYTNSKITASVLRTSCRLFHSAIELHFSFFTESYWCEFCWISFWTVNITLSFVFVSQCSDNSKLHWISRSI